MTVLHAREALTPSGWQRDVRIGIEDGRIAFIEAGGEARAGDERHAVALPAIPNLHSHAFQRGMAGLAERRGETADTFWTWREVMYRFALSMTPGQLEAVAGQLYMEMLEAGFSRVGEFHYLHNDRDGRPYADIAELARRIAAAAGTTGIGLTLLPVFYAHASFGGLPPTEGQRRFITDVDGFARLLEESRSAIAGLENAVLGVAPHSLRAVTPEELAAVTAMCPAGPVHIHAAEQVREVEDCLAWSGARPVQWLLDNAGIDGRWCLIHATHMTDDETRRMARAGAVAGLCPLTEASLGDGIFNGPEFAAAGGRWGVGSDSNIQIGVADELRQLEYAQRLRLRERNVMARAGGSTGRALLEAALEGGGIAMGRPSRGLATGDPADLLTLDTESPALCERSGDALLDAWIFTGARAVDCVWVAGVRRVAGGRHVRREEITARFRRAMRELCSQ
ncbi:formimidoylglutamate deiminase [Marinimicrococcus flavescens]|uniref:Formimidoylglutamate deiminase n=1 Tax=Marinimicrococcus flavescens TaxID=3031815 RepID=A0AAP3UYW8_9PROT|nr:formimidoylglutamate deiminase [Marinimicrococcus flavescens]